MPGLFGAVSTLVTSDEFCDDENNLVASLRTFNLTLSGDRRSTLAKLGFTERRVLQEIRRAGRIHRLEIATRCDLQPSTLTRAAGLLNLARAHPRSQKLGPTGSANPSRATKYPSSSTVINGR